MYEGKRERDSENFIVFKSSATVFAFSECEAI